MKMALDSSLVVRETHEHAPHIDPRGTGALADLEELGVLHDVAHLQTTGDEQ
jgi:hypothetical protein